jgi:hypothetical protein
VYTQTSNAETPKAPLHSPPVEPLKELLKVKKMKKKPEEGQMSIRALVGDAS